MNRDDSTEQGTSVSGPSSAQLQRAEFTLPRLEAYMMSERNKYGQLPQVECADGATISVQASRFHYCSPREDGGPWHQVECGFPSVKPNDAMLPFMDGQDGDPTKTVYGYVPLDVVAEFIDQHGGFKTA